jgi:hypothetical protein
MTDPPGRAPADGARPDDDARATGGVKRGKPLTRDGQEEPQEVARPAPSTPSLVAPAAAPPEPRIEPSRARPVAPPLPVLPAEPGEAVVSGAILPAAAHLHLSSETLGEVALHLRIQDGAAHVRVEGGARAAVESRAPELARALAAEGLGLARIEHEPRNPQQPGGGGAGDLSRDGSGGSRDTPARHGGDQPRDGAAPPRAEARTARAAARKHGGAHDVTA